jgi:protein phosphatase
MLVGAAAEGARRRSPGAAGGARDTGELEPVGDTAPIAVEDRRRGGASAAGHDADLDPEEARYAPRPPKRLAWARRSVLALGLLLAIVLIAVAAYRWTQDQYYVGQDAETVAVYRGIEADIPGITTHRVEESSELRLADLPEAYAREVSQGISASSLNDARDIVARLERRVICPDPVKPLEPTASPSARPSPSPSASPSASPSTAPALCTEADE